jgi:hypothetical protein
VAARASDEVPPSLTIARSRTDRGGRAVLEFGVT